MSTSPRADKLSALPIDDVRITIGPEMKKSLRALRSAIDAEKHHDFDPLMREMLDAMIAGETTQLRVVMGEMAFIASESARCAEKLHSSELRNALDTALSAVVGSRNKPSMIVNLRPKTPDIT